MTIIYGDFQGFASSDLSAYPVSYFGLNANSPGLFNNSVLAKEMMELLPSYYWLGNSTRRIMELISVVLADYYDKIDDLRDQFFIETATWGLIFWEQLVGCPVNEFSTDYAFRRACIYAHLRDCSSEKCFVEGLEEITQGKVIVTLLNPQTNPYQIDIELRSPDVVFNGPSTAPVAALAGAGNLTGDYTYKVTFEFPPAVVPDYIVPAPDIGFSETSSGVTSIRTNEIQQIELVGVNEVQNIEVTAGSGTFELTFDGEETISGLTENSTADDIVVALNLLYITPTNTYGPFSVSTLDGVTPVNTPGGIDRKSVV